MERRPGSIGQGNREEKFAEVNSWIESLQQNHTPKDDPETGFKESLGK
ncbi:MAG TPA: hypothetical protein VIM13_08415 [Clostridia bacterium]